MLEEGAPPTAAARVRVDADIARRWLTGASVQPHEMEVEGPPRLINPMLGVRGIIT